MTISELLKVSEKAYDYLEKTSRYSKNQQSVYLTELVIELKDAINSIRTGNISLSPTDKRQ